jgi:glycolate oxidase FAD binding subunit
LSFDALAPADHREAVELVRARQTKAALDIVGGGTRLGFGRPPEGAERITTAKLNKIVFHEPAEMILRAEAGPRFPGRAVS